MISSFPEWFRVLHVTFPVYMKEWAMLCYRYSSSSSSIALYTVQTEFFF